MSWFDSNSAPPTQQEIFNASMQHAEQQFNNCAQDIQNKLSISIDKAVNIAGDAMLTGAEFMSDYGGVIAIACYASGNIGLGMVVDGITIACDISLTAYKYNNGEIDSKNAMVEITSSVLIAASGMKCGKNFENAAKRVLLDPKTTEIVSNCITDFTSQGLATINDIINE